jgi:hypothetical protein
MNYFVIQVIQIYEQTRNVSNFKFTLDCLTMRVYNRYLPVHRETINGIDFTTIATPLTEYLRLSGCCLFVKTLLYDQMPKYFRWNFDHWTPRRKSV